jgi:hypothetical protein
MISCDANHGICRKVFLFRTPSPAVVCGRSPRCICPLDERSRLTERMKLKVGDFLWKFIKLGSAWSGQLPDLGLATFLSRAQTLPPPTRSGPLFQKVFERVFYTGQGLHNRG